LAWKQNVDKASEKQVSTIIIAIRACFGRLRSVADALHADVGVTAAMRAVMEALFDGDEWTVPALARDKRVSRQNIQVIVDALAAAGLVAFADNPSHKRSSLVVLTKRGRSTFIEMRRRERAVLRAVAEVLTPDTAEATLKTLVAMQRRLEKMEREPSNPKGESDE
jgi:DNA-binding MarR family transcriptional regulator